MQEEGLVEGQRLSWRERVSNSSHWGDGKGLPHEGGVGW